MSQLDYDRDQYDDETIKRIITVYRQEAWHAKRNRMALNAQNFEMYHHRQDWRHKKSGQSKEFLPKLSNAVEALTYFVQQGLVDQREWFSVERAAGDQDELFTEDVIKKILESQLGHNDIYNHIGDSIKMGALGSLMINKTYGLMKNFDKYVFGHDAERNPKVSRITRSRWQLKLSLVRQENFYPDPELSGLYFCEDIQMDYHDLLRIARENPDEYDVDAIETLGEYRDFYDVSRKARETDQNITYENARRKRVMVTECWGTFVDQDGNVILENGVAAMANRTTLIRRPQKNKSWTGRHPYTVSPITRVPFSVWHRSLMDAPAALNQAENELFNLMLDGAMMSVHGIKQIREDWLDDATQISDGIGPGDTLRANSSCPPGAHVLERIDTSAVPSDGMAMYQLLDREFQSASMSPDIRMGTLPQRNTKATEIVSANQSLNGITGGMVKTIEEQYVAPMLDQCWTEIAQHLKEMDEDELRSILGDDVAARVQSLSNEEIFARSVNGNSFKVFGLSMTLSKMNDFRKIGALLQTIAAEPPLMQAFGQKYDMSKLLGEIIKSLDIDESKIAISQSPQTVTGMMGGVAPAGSGSPAGVASTMPTNGQGQGADVQSQIASIAGTSPESGVQIPRAAILAGMTEPNG